MILHREIVRERHTYSEKALELYKNELKGVSKESHLLTRPDWVNICDEKGKLIPLRHVNVELDTTYRWDPKKNIRIWKNGRNDRLIHGPRLPYRKDGYADNVKMALGKYIVKEPNYALIGVESDGNEIKLTVRYDRYFDFYDTCDFMTYELAYKMHRTGADKSIELSDLPYRKGLSPFEMENRFAGIGVCTLTILKNFDSDRGDEKGAAFLIHQRSSGQAEGGGAFHVVPAGSYQPLSTIKLYNCPEEDLYEELKRTVKDDLTNTVIREFMEEVIDHDLYSRLASEDLLEKKLKEICADVFFLGVGFEPLNAKAEIMACIIVDVKNSEIFKKARTIKALEEKIKKSYEGEVKVHDFSLDWLKHYENNIKSIPACREILRTVIKRFDMFNDHKVNNNLNYP